MKRKKGNIHLTIALLHVKGAEPFKHITSKPIETLDKESKESLRVEFGQFFLFREDSLV